MTSSLFSTQRIVPALNTSASKFGLSPFSPTTAPPALEPDALSDECDDLEGLERPTLWQQICEILKPPEVEVMERTVGSQLVQDLSVVRAELDALLTILRDYRSEQTQQQKTQHREMLRMLPAAPERTLLEARLRSVLRQLGVVGGEGSVGSQTPRTTRGGVLSVGTPVLARSSSMYGAGYVPSTPREQQVVEYVLGDSLSRPSSASASISTATPTLQTLHDRSRPGSAGSMPSSTGSNFSVDHCREKLNVVDVDDILADLRSAIKDEVESLTTSVEYVRQALEDAVLSARAPPPPTTNELKELQKKLEVEAERMAHEQRVANLPGPVPATLRQAAPSSPGPAAAPPTTAAATTAVAAQNKTPAVAGAKLKVVARVPVPPQGDRAGSSGSAAGSAVSVAKRSAITPPSSAGVAAGVAANVSSLTAGVGVGVAVPRPPSTPAAAVVGGGRKTTAPLPGKRVAARPTVSGSAARTAPPVQSA